MAINDDFTRANQTNLGAASVSGVSQGWSWSTGDVESGNSTSINILSNQAAKETGSSSPCVVRAEIDASSSDNSCSINIVARGITAGGIGPYCRLSSGAGPSGYLAYLLSTSDTVQLYKNTGGTSFTQIGSDSAVTVSLPDDLKVEAIGTAIKSYYNGVQCVNASATDSGVTTGLRVGMRMDRSTDGARIVASMVGDGFASGVFSPYFYRQHIAGGMHGESS